MIRIFEKVIAQREVKVEITTWDEYYDKIHELQKLKKGVIGIDVLYDPQVLPPKYDFNTFIRNPVGQTMFIRDMTFDGLAKDIVYSLSGTIHGDFWEGRYTQHALMTLGYEKIQKD